MQADRPLKLKIASRKDFMLPAIVVTAVVSMISLLSSQPLPMIMLTGVLLGPCWYHLVLSYSGNSALKLTSVIFRDGTLKLESDGQSVIKGVISGQQWISRWVSVLRYSTSGKHQSLFVFSAQQNADDYRRLMVWLRQDLLLKSEGRIQS